MPKIKTNNKLKVIELFAGVGGFRLGLEGFPGKNSKSRYRVIWSNQYEPATKPQYAADIYQAIWGDIDNRDINNVIENDFDVIPDHDILTAGFPCQDYSVARPLNQAAGIQGRKGVLWWSIYEIIRQKKHKPGFLILENVDRLLKSPAAQRGRDFALILNSLAEQGYAVEWRVINAADYGFPQRRRRIFLLGYHKKTALFEKLKKRFSLGWIVKNGVLAKAFPAQSEVICTHMHSIDKDPVVLSKCFGVSREEKSPFGNAGIMQDFNFISFDVKPAFSGEKMCLGDILLQPSEVPQSFYINGSLEKWKYLKGAKQEPRKTIGGHLYNYAEGAMSFPDPLDKPARTIITGEGGSSPSRFKHVVQDEKGIRRLTPIELERLNGFPDDHTKIKGISDIKRAFLMGNALVVGLVERIGSKLAKEI